MNKRITDLHNQAIIFSGKNGGLRISSHIPNDYIEKFAELIIQECVNVAMRSVGDDEPKEAWYLIQEHFGVEE